MMKTPVDLLGAATIASLTTALGDLSPQHTKRSNYRDGPCSQSGCVWSRWQDSALGSALLYQRASQEPHVHRAGSQLEACVPEASALG